MVPDYRRAHQLAPLRQPRTDGPGIPALAMHIAPSNERTAVDRSVAGGQHLDLADLQIKSVRTPFDDPMLSSAAIEALGRADEMGLGRFGPPILESRIWNMPPCLRKFVAGGPERWQRRPQFARHCRADGVGIIALSAAHRPGGAHGWRVEDGLQPGPDPDGKVVALFRQGPDRLQVCHSALGAFGFAAARL